MVKVFDASIILEGVCFDVQRLLREGNSKGAYNILKRKLNEIDTIEKSSYSRIRW
jgi:hypothetical protein